MQTLERPITEIHQFDPETRRYNDTVTWLAEVLPGSMRTPFEYRFDGHELYASDGSEVEKIFDDSIERAKNLPSYELRRRYIEKEEYYEMIAMMRGDLPNTMVVVSDFPPELIDATQDVGGYNAERKQTMLRVLNRTPEGTLKMYSQSLDRSNRQALEAIYRTLDFTPRPGELLGQRMHLELGSHEQEFLVDQLAGVYDRNLQMQYGGEWYAGRRGRGINTYDFVCQQKELVNSYLAIKDSLTGDYVDYSLAAKMKERYLGRKPTNNLEYLPAGVAAHAMTLAEMFQAGDRAIARGETFSGCGASIKARQDMSAEAQLEESGLGNKANKPGEDKYGSLQFKCPKKGCLNIRPRDKLIAKCQKCGADVRC